MRVFLSFLLFLIFSVLVSAQSPDVTPDVVSVGIVPVGVISLPVLGVSSDFFGLSVNFVSYSCLTMLPSFSGHNVSFAGLAVCPVVYSVNLRFFGVLLPLMQIVSALAGVTIFRMVRQ